MSRRRGGKGAEQEAAPLKTLWTFETQAKLEDFVSILQNHDIAYEIAAKGNPQKPNNEVTLSVAEGDYEKAKKLLLKHRKRRTSRDYRAPMAPGHMPEGE
jgi:hypothetical protein